MVDQDCMRAIKKLNELFELRPEPSDTLINIAETCQNLNLSDEGWCNFYEYITTTDREAWKYKPRSAFKTMGDLTEEELEKIEADLQGRLNCNMEYTGYENGIETFIDCHLIEDEKKEE